MIYLLVAAPCTPPARTVKILTNHIGYKSTQYKRAIVEADPKLALRPTCLSAVVHITKLPVPGK